MAAILLRLIAGYVVAFCVAQAFGASGSPPAFLAVLLVACAGAALLLDNFDYLILESQDEEEQRPASGQG